MCLITPASSRWCRAPRPRWAAPCPTRSTGGGSDANVFAARGIEVANLACGMREIHTVNEWVDIRDLVLTAELVVETVRLNAAA
jgi:di/tripeptidase